MEPQTLTGEEIHAETVAIKQILARLTEFKPAYATPDEGQEFARLIKTHKNTKVFLLSTEWGQANPPPRDFKITLVKAWPQGGLALPRNHIS